MNNLNNGENLYIDKLTDKNMADLTQQEADTLIQTKKKFIDSNPIVIDGLNTQRELVSQTNSEIKFYLNIRQSAVEFGIFSSVNRYFSQPLVRLCVDPDCVHENPDGQIIKGSHIHFYKEGHKDYWAYPLSQHGFTSEEIVSCMGKFLDVCNIKPIKIIKQQRVGE